MMYRTLLFSLLLLTACRTLSPTADVSALSSQRVTLPNGWSLTPAGHHLPLGDLPLQAAVSPDGRFLAVNNNGVDKHLLQVFDTHQEAMVCEVGIDKSWYGLSFSADGKRLFASGGNDNLVAVFSVDKGKLKRDTSILLGAPWPNNIWVTGVCSDAAQQRVFAVTKNDSSLYVCNTINWQVNERIPLGSPAYACLFAPKQNRLYVSLWGNAGLAVFDASNMKRLASVAVGNHPNEMILSKDESRLFVANANDNSVSVLDTRTLMVGEVLQAALYPDALAGSTTNSLALSQDEKTLYIANADNNCLAVFDVANKGESRSMGFIPTGWYPTSVRTAAGKIFVCNGKGMASAANPGGPQPTMKREDSRAAAYIGKLFKGTLSIITPPDAKTLAAYSRLVLENSPYSKEIERQTEGEAGNPVPSKVGDPSPIRYVFYIVKENRTYDQVLGDVKEGNGDASLCLFPEKITPNQHALAREFVLLDNFYVNAEVSADGHNWSMAGYASDYVEKTWPTSYGGKGGGYDFEGSTAIAFPNAGYIWDNCKRSGVSYRTYGEFADDFKANYKTLEGHVCPGYSSWDLNIQDVVREQVWEHDFDSLLASGQLARFNTIRFGNDHTSGMRKDAYSPEAAVADNDQAVGRLIEHLSKSGIWKESAVFILEDDAQNGPDHVDAHRSIAFLASPYVKRGYVDHTPYTTASMLRTIELILGMPPMSQYDAAATPMWRCFTSKPDVKPYQNKMNQVSIDTRNLAVNELSKISESFNLAQLDAVPERLFNEVLWKAIKGIHTEMPAPRRSAFVRSGDDD
ncbi:MAG: bifunctional YncE family protein/alkaline phosphatase family protein [Lewinellaceae bacterium]|nr:bifunctional YncE family protein/alkaline phosphatase family protein [Lewinellaceae bacterium]